MKTATAAAARQTFFQSASRRPSRRPKCRRGRRSRPRRRPRRRRTPAAPARALVPVLSPRAAAPRAARPRPARAGAWFCCVVGVDGGVARGRHLASARPLSLAVVVKPRRRRLGDDAIDAVAAPLGRADVRKGRAKPRVTEGRGGGVAVVAGREGARPRRTARASRLPQLRPRGPRRLRAGWRAGLAAARRRRRGARRGRRRGPQPPSRSSQSSSSALDSFRAREDPRAPGQRATARAS